MPGSKIRTEEELREETLVFFFIGKPHMEVNTVVVTVVSLM